MRRKGFVFNLSLVMVTLIVLISLFLVLQGKKSKVEPIGSRQFELTEAYQKGENVRFFVEQSAKYSLSQAIYDLSQNGGFAESGACGSYAGYQVWLSDKKCFPNYQEELTNRFQLLLARYLLIYGAELPLEYSSSVKSSQPLTLVSSANSAVVINIISKELAAKKYTDQSLRDESKSMVAPKVVQKNDKDLMPKIFNLYESSIMRATLNYPNIKHSLIAGVIAQESKGDPFAVGGCGVGLTQFELDTAKAYSKIFQKLPQSCKDSCNPKCDISTDDRLNPDKSIAASVLYYNDLIGIFGKYTDKVKFAIAAYNGGPTVIRKAIDATKKSNPSWEEVSSSIRPEFITYVSSESRKIWKIGVIQDYVNKVSSYQQDYELLEASAKEQQYEQEKSKFGTKVKTHDCCICRQTCGDDCAIFPVDAAVACGPWSIGKGLSCDMKFCTYTPKSVSTYEIRPSFTLSVDYNLDIYKQIIEAITKNEGIIDQVKKCQNPDQNGKKTLLKECVDLATKLAQSKDFAWKTETDCDTPREMVLNSFVENYQMCAESNDDQCVCEFSMDIGKNNNPDGTYDVIIRKQDSMTEFVPDDALPIPKVDLVYSTYYFISNDKISKPLSDKLVRYSVRYKKGVFSTASIDIPDQGISQISKNVHIFKKGSQMAVMNDEYYNTYFTSVKKCNVSKRVYRFCVEKLNNGIPEKITALNPISAKVEPLEIVYRFALAFPKP
jgi:soluble lytic murein transglycosylase-like protein